MKKAIFWGILCLLSIAYAQAQTYSYQTLEVGTPYTFKNLRLYPIRTKANFEVGKLSYRSLAEAMVGKLLILNELETLPTTPNTREASNLPTRTQGSMNTIQVENTSQDTLYLMAGEIIQGGKQDRVIAQDLIIPPASGRVSIPVFCVEEGRWQSNTQDTSAHFQQYFGIATLQVRKSVEKEQNQYAVWSQVRRALNENNVQTKTDAYTAQIENPYIKTHTPSYLAYFEEKLQAEKNMIGVLVVTGDKILGCDMFANPALFHTQKKSLLLAYILEALTYGFEVNIPPKTVQQYLDALLTATTQADFIKKQGKVFIYEGIIIRITTF